MSWAPAAANWFAFESSGNRTSWSGQVRECDWVAEELQEDSASSQGTSPTSARPLLLFLIGAPGSGKTTFYETKLHESFPILLKTSASPLEQSQMEQQRKELLRARKSFVLQSAIVDMDLLKEARPQAFDVKVIFIGTEHPDLNIARILSRVSRGGLFAPIATLHQEYASGLRQLKALAKAADELVLLDNTAEGRGPRAIARITRGQIAKLARSRPEWAERVFESEFSRWLDRQRQSLRQHTR
jgi:predicted ABC-type ATPase